MKGLAFTAVIACIFFVAKAKGTPSIEPEEDIVEIKIDSAKIEKIDKLLTNAFNKGRFNGQVLYAEKGQVLYQSTFGYENLKTKTPLTDTSVFQIASTSKPFTAIAILKLYEEKKLDINQSVIFYLPDFPFKEITIKHLLQHRSGLPNYMYTVSGNWDFRKTLTNEDISPLFRKAKVGLAFKPGARFQYCNTNYAYLASIVEKITGQDFQSYMKNEIFDPIGMKHTYVYCHAERNNKNAVKGYDYSRKRGFYERQCDYLDGVKGDKGIYSTASDLFLFDQALYDENFISPKVLEMAFTPTKPFDDKHKRDYGLGFRLKEETDGNQIAYHHGWWKGFRTYFIHDYQNQRTLIWLNNRSDVNVAPYISEIMNSSIGDDEHVVLGGGDK